MKVEQQYGQLVQRWDNPTAVAVTWKQIRFSACGAWASHVVGAALLAWFLRELRSKFRRIKIV